MQPVQYCETVILTKTPIPVKTQEGPKKEKLKEYDEKPLPKISTDLKISIQKARIANKLTQKELAQKLGIQPMVIQNYENGKAIPNNLDISKMEKILKTKLPRIKK